jgi:hypothetical protein
MADYQNLLQPVAQALLTIDTAGDPVIVGQGFASVERGATPAGDFILTLDSGTDVADVGSGTLVGEPGFGYSDGVVGPNGLDPRLSHVALTVRGGTGGLTLGATILSNLTASFITAPDTGALQIEITTAATPALGGQQDPMGAGVANTAGSGLEIFVWKLAIPDNVNFQASGPLYNPALVFP